MNCTIETDSTRLLLCRRFSGTWIKKYALLLYTPIGCLLLLLRVFIAFHAFVVSCILLPFPSIRKPILRLFAFTCGIAIVEHRLRANCGLEVKCDSVDQETAIISNSVTCLDPLIIDLCHPCKTFKLDFRPCDSLFKMTNFNLPPSQTPISDDVVIDKARNFYKSGLQPVLFFPEGKKRGCADMLLKFTTTAFAIYDHVSLIGLSVYRPWIFDSITTSTVNSNSLTDTLWTFFVPLTIYNVKCLSPCPFERNRDESVVEFANRAKNVLAQALNLKTSESSFADLLLRLNRSASDYDSKIVSTVKRILPAVEFSVIREESENESSVDVILLKILKKNYASVVSGIPSRVNKDRDFRSFQQHFEAQKALLISENLFNYLRRNCCN